MVCKRAVSANGTAQTGNKMASLLDEAFVYIQDEHKYTTAVYYDDCGGDEEDVSGLVMGESGQDDGDASAGAACCVVEEEIMEVVEVSEVAGFFEIGSSSPLTCKFCVLYCKNSWRLVLAVWSVNICCRSKHNDM